MNDESTPTPVNDPLRRPDWVPLAGHRLRKAGVYFDAVAIAGSRAAEVADIIEEESEGHPGPIVHDVTGYRWMYFLLPPGSSREHLWPPGTGRYGTGTFRDAYVGIPALEGRTWPLRWRARPEGEGAFVDPLLLHATVCPLMGWEPKP